MNRTYGKYGAYAGYGRSWWEYVIPVYGPVVTAMDVYDYATKTEEERALEAEIEALQESQEDEARLAELQAKLDALKAEPEDLPPGTDLAPTNGKSNGNGTNDKKGPPGWVVPLGIGLTILALGLGLAAWRKA